MKTYAYTTTQGVNINELKQHARQQFDRLFQGAEYFIETAEVRALVEHHGAGVTLWEADFLATGGITTDQQRYEVAATSAVDVDRGPGLVAGHRPERESLPHHIRVSDSQGSR
jgi:hypothetical protein